MKNTRNAKLWGLILLVLLVMMAGCAESDSPPATNGGGTNAGSGDLSENTTAEPEKSAAETSDDPIVFGFAQVGAESEWRTANTESIQTAAEEAGIELKFSDAQQKQENQIKAIRSFIAQKVDVIGFSPVVESGWETVLKEAKDAGIPVILVDRAVDVEDDSLYESFIGSDFVEEGRKAARLVVEHFEDQEGPIRIVELQGTVGSAPAIDRKAGFEEIISEYDKFEITQSQTGDFTRAKGKEVMEAFLKSDGENIDVLYGHNDDMAIGAIQAIEEYGLKPAEDIYIVSVDGVRGAFEAMVAGKLNATVECNPLMGSQVMDMVKKLAAGEELPKRVVVEETFYTMDQAEEVLPTRKY